MISSSTNKNLRVDLHGTNDFFVFDKLTIGIRQDSSTGHSLLSFRYYGFLYLVACLFIYR